MLWGLEPDFRYCLGKAKHDSPWLYWLEMNGKKEEGNSKKEQKSKEEGLKVAGMGSCSPGDKCVAAYQVLDVDLQKDIKQTSVQKGLKITVLLC